MTSLVAQTVSNLPAMQETPVWSLGREDPLEEEMATCSRFLPGEFHGQRRLVGYSPWGHKECDTTERLTHCQSITRWLEAQVTTWVCKWPLKLGQWWDGEGENLVGLSPYPGGSEAVSRSTVSELSWLSGHPTGVWELLGHAERNHALWLGSESHSSQKICCSVSQLCQTLCDPMDCSMPGFPVLHYFLKFAQTHVHWVGDTIQPSHPLLPPSSLSFSRHQGLFYWVVSLRQVAKVLEL